MYANVHDVCVGELTEESQLLMMTDCVNVC